jgi:CYTH domain-containing protein/CHAD domain-containing protein
VPREARRVVSERLTEAISILEDLEEADSGDIERAVHHVRKRCKEVRAVARLVRSSIGGEFNRINLRVREAADTLAPVRDAHAVLATFDQLRAASGQRDDADLARVRAGLAHTADAATQTVHGGDARIEHARTLLVAARKRVKRWECGDGFAPLEAGIEDTYRRGRKALRRARIEPSDEHVHEWRKSVKHLWYQTRLIEQAAPSALQPLIASLDDLAEALGDDHDLVVLVERLTADPDRFGGKRSVKRARRLARLQQDDLRRRGFRLGATIYAETPSAFTQRMQSYWDLTQREGPELFTGGIAELAADERCTSAAAGANTATVERERKFLVDTLPELPDEGIALRQGYLAIDGSVSVRVRDAGRDGCTLTIKAGHGAVHTELEFELGADQFAAAWEQTGGRRIHKTRHRLTHGTHTVELDVFHDDLNGLIVAEVEFDSDESLAAFEPPEWFGPEVTGDVAYTNASLAVNAPRGRPTNKPAA